jgi:hypothetical protein
MSLRRERMNFKTVAVLLVAMLTSSGVLAAEGDKSPSLATGPAVPILAWGGVPSDAPPERFAELAAAGFTHNYSGAGNAENLQKVLDVAHAHGLKQMISSGELQSDPEGTARRFKDHPANGGYYLRDEPGATQFAELAAWAKRIQSVDTTNPCYVNLLPTYGEPGQWGAPDYEKYLERFIAEVPTPMLSFDHYPIHRKGKDAASDIVRGDFYYNLELASAAARKANRPLWAFVLATAHNPYPIPEVSHLRLQAFSNLAYGSQAIQYFTYWTSKSDVWNFHQGPIEVDGTRTPTYDRVKQMNAEIQAVRGAFIGSKVVSVGHTGAAIPHGTTRYTPVSPMKSLETAGEQGAVVSLLSRGNERFLAVVNRDIHKPMPLTIEFDGSAEVSVARNSGELSPVREKRVAVELEPGNMVVLSWQAR